MKFSLLPVIAFYMVVLDAAHETLLPSELYWKSKLPTTPMPKSIRDLLHPTAMNEKPDLTHQLNWQIGTQSGYGTTVHGGTEYRLEDIWCVNYCYKNNGNKLHDNDNIALFFLEKDLKAGHRMNLFFTQTSNQASFLPREVLKFIPFTSSKMAEILNKFAVKPGTVKAEVMHNTIKLCEESGIKGEEKYCATSLESMVDFIASKHGRHVEALSTEVVKETKKQEYTITHGVKKVGAETKAAVCHKLNYVYAVFYCHKIENSHLYGVVEGG